MASIPSNFVRQERKLIAEKKALLPLHRGEARYQSTLDNDRSYREMVLAALGLSLFAASGFSQISATSSPERSALLCIAAVGFALRAIAPRVTTPASGKSFVEGPTSHLISGGVLGFGLLGSILGGTNGMITFLGVSVVAGMMIVSTNVPKLRTFFYGLAEMSLVTFLAWTLGVTGETFSIGSAAIGMILGFVAVGSALFGNRNFTWRMQSTMVLSSLATYGWIVITLFTTVAAPWNILLTVVAFAAYAILERMISLRSAFAPIVVVVILLHLSIFLDRTATQGKPISPQVIVLLLEFGLLGMAGYRHSLASLARLPLATYRSSPQCLVPTFDHAWDHPLKIDAV